MDSSRLADGVSPETAAPPPTKPRSHLRVGTWIGWVVVVVIGLAAIRSFAGNENMQWDVVREYLFARVILIGVLMTLALTALSQLLGTVVGLAAAYARESTSSVLIAVSAGYIWFFRATPALVQLLLWFNLALLFPEVGVHVPLLGIEWSYPTNLLISGFVAALLGLGLTEGAYMAEIFRAGIKSIPKGQMEAALSIGMKRQAALIRIVTPQSLRVIIPPTGNQIIGLLKATSLVSVVGGGELLTRVQYIYGSNFAVIPLLTVATIWYLILVSIGSVIQGQIEKRLDYDRGRPKTRFSFARRLNPISTPLSRGRTSEIREIAT